MNEQGFPVEVIIKNVKFLIPVEVEIAVLNSISGDSIAEGIKIQGSINLIHKEFNTQQELPESILNLVRKNLFEFLNKNSVIDTEQFELDDEIYEQASKAQSAHDDLHKDNVEA